MTRRVVVVGAGIVGSALAASLAQSGDVAVTVLEAGPADRLVGSTGHATGFVLHPQRLRGRPRDELRERALRLYRDIYATA